MRLWHINLIPHLPRQQLLGQHRECAALRGNGWGKPHATVDYVFQHPYSWLFHYHKKIMKEMRSRGYNVDPQWRALGYRGKKIGWDVTTFCTDGGKPQDYPEHNAEYLAECLGNLRGKGIAITVTPTL
jgi:uncharacterized protein (TIGR02328 family)